MKDIPIIIVSARKDDIDKIRGLGLGADDYVTKPFSASEMVAQLASELGTYFKLVKYNNGAEGFKGVMETKPAMVVCDVMLPDMDGYEIVGKLKKDPAFENTPVIMLTALDDVNHQIKGYKVIAANCCSRSTSSHWMYSPTRKPRNLGLSATATNKSRRALLTCWESAANIIGKSSAHNHDILRFCFFQIIMNSKRILYCS